MDPTGESASTAAEPMSPHPVLPAYFDDLPARGPMVDRLFDDTAAHYDRITGLLSFGSGGRYRREVLEQAGVQPGQRVLDLACGTGQVSEAAARLVGAGGAVLGVDPSAGMLAVAVAKMRRLREAEPRTGPFRAIAGGAEALPLSDQSVDVVTMGYALRHVPDLVGAFREMRRVLRPGGRVVVMEISAPANPLLRWPLKAYLRGVVPPLSRWITGDPRSRTLMAYYWDTMEHCVPPSAIQAAMAAAGLVAVERRRLWGTFSNYLARSPKQRND
ncbi:class I SAM-dependent methyltransferase [Phycisphaera mikurensis]|uniref:Ubiquinone/menaquinone biosynthesis methyltransferase UbiE n=1 Tax=Phycisphaera mikurensis (strain NBRC 102666 / KCTC 22515 / FYK2301M01) TaxID=1142394 RepID=I0IAX6_PHYMF|nr:class I SAM-dependent methyltransferase [Phycisphaera mikurensis]MBB6442612.1 demethylmenaquinone methyltransferase/2-methoxy-6-polyprenyl-1,4-benzoquinol methylase [Phycisphaera mikurensis]BAM02414.1 ubiquinone/menaquinone biosynthesis methyltransferase UbiE [Phycisphaera mikurensis NBRC 102666]